MKRTHKLRGMAAPDISAVLARHSNNVSAASRELGVSRDSVHRWLRTGAVARPALGPRLAVAASDEPVVADEPVTPASWADAIRRNYVLTETENALLALAAAALGLALDVDEDRTLRLAAAGRFQGLVRQLRLEEAPHGATAATRYPRAV